MIATQRQTYARRRPVLRPARQQAVRVVLSEEEFRLALSRERQDADLCQRHFSLAVFRLPAGTLRPSTDPQVMSILAQRAGLSHTVGRLGSSGLGILLRETDTEKAWQFCARAGTELAEIGADVTWRLICYPDGFR